MAWTTPRTWVAGEVVTAAIMNTHVRDDLAYLYRVAGLINTAGATVTGTGFSSSRSALGSYSITFSPSFTATPVVVLGIADTANFGVVDFSVLPTTSGFSVSTVNQSFASADRGWSFTAQSVT